MLKMPTHNHGLDILGAQLPGFLPGKKKRAIVIQINNAPQLAAAEGGTAGAWASTIAPDTIEQQVYLAASDKLVKALRENNVDATVKVMDATNWSLDSDDLGAAKYTAMGFAGASVLGLLGYFWLRKK